MTKKGRTRTVVCALAFLVLGAGVCAACTDGYTNWNKFGWFGKSAQKPGEEETPTFSGVTDGEGNELTSGTTYGMPIAMVYSLTSEESETARSGITIEAVVTPSCAVNKAVDYSVAFVNAESDWAVGKTVTDYITVEPEADGSAKAKVFCHETFGEQIIITVTSRSNPEIADSCTVDYAQRVTGVTLSIGEELTYDILNENAHNLDINIGSSTEGKGGALALNYTLSDTYTIAQEFTQSVEFPHDENSMYGKYVYYTIQGGAGRSSGVACNSPELGDVYHIDRRLFDELNFHDFSTSMSGENGEWQTTTTPWSEKSVDDLKDIFDDMTLPVQGSTTSKISYPTLWDYEVTISSQYITYTLNGKFIWASISGWENVTGIEIKVDGKDEPSAIF